ncbi:MAG TPA: IS5 family transposase [Nitrososphaeraceae archaeon]|nr:IS5 family transposase [Nitrososphaeraceae archaeon]
MRNWKNYNESLVKRGEILLDFDVIDNWNTELSEMNKNKEGRKFVYPDSFIKLLGYMRVYFHLPYRQTEGVVREHAFNTLPSIPDYSNISRRINRLDIKISLDGGPDKSDLHNDDNFVIAIDSTGIKVTNRGEWIRHKWKVKRGYLKIHLAVDIKRKRIISLDVISEQVHDSKVLPVLIENITIKQNKIVNTVITDGSYDNNKNFRFLSFKGIKPPIKVRKNFRCRKTNHYLRNKTVKMQKNNLQQWKVSVDYGQRWIVETVFSCIKRMFGEYVTAIRFENMIKEIMLKASLYNLFQSITIK